jgi:hypothetical protein
VVLGDADQRAAGLEHLLRVDWVEDVDLEGAPSLRERDLADGRRRSVDQPSSRRS